MSIVKQRIEFKHSERVSIKDRWDKLHESSNWNNISYDGWKLPATGASKLGCGEWLTEGCLNAKNHNGVQFLDGIIASGKIFRRTYQKSCYRAECPECYLKWLAREANRGTHKIESYAKKMKEKPIHVIVSIPIWHHNKDVQELRRASYDILDKLGIKAGCMILHPFRYDRKQKSWYYSPHFHIIGFGWVNDPRQVYRDSGFIVKNLGIRKSVYATLYYQLSHCGIKKGKHSVTWFGHLSNGNIAKYHPECKPIEEKREHLCPICQCKLRPLIWVRTDRPPPQEDFEGFDEAYGWIYARGECG
jgi:hypothetical protein